MKISELKHKYPKIYDLAVKHRREYAVRHARAMGHLSEDSIGSAFRWSDTDEGSSFWSAMDRSSIDRAKEVCPELFEELPSRPEFVIGSYKGDLEGFPIAVVEKMLDNQELQGNKRNIDFFEDWVAGIPDRFDWHSSPEGQDFWSKVISNKQFDVFFDKYPESQDEDDLTLKTISL